MANLITVFGANEQKVEVEVEYEMTIIQILNEACKKLNLNSDEYDLKDQDRTLEVTESFGLALISTNAVLELKKLDQPRKSQELAMQAAVENFSSGAILGSTIFSYLVNSTTFVDKTMLIKEVVTSSESVILITCPRRFGKSTNMQMLKAFFQIEVDELGRPVDAQTTVAYRLFRDKKLKLAAEKEIVEKHQGKYPVIYIDFLNVRDTDYVRLKRRVRHAISKAFKQHSYMTSVLQSKIDDPNEKEERKKLLREELNTFEQYLHKKVTTDEDELEIGLTFLMEILRHHFNTKVYVLIDEYDAPVNNSIHLNITEADKVVQLMNGIMCSLFKGNDDNLERGIITGISGIVRAAATSGLNNASEYKFLHDHAFSNYYGFTQSEVEQIFRRAPDMQEIAKKWYDGYLTQAGVSIYNPWSIIKFIKQKKALNYWHESVSVGYLSDLFKIGGIRSTIQELISEDAEFTFELNTNVGLDDVKRLQELLNYKGGILQQQEKEEYCNLFFSYLFEMGYFSYANKESTSTYKLPNEEIRSEFARKLRYYYVNTNILNGESLKKAMNEFNKCISSITVNRDDLNDLEKTLQKLFKPLTLVDVRTEDEEDGQHMNEDLFHSIINVVLIETKYNQFGTEVHYKSKRPDIILTNNRVNLGVVIEVKYDTTAAAALQQAASCHSKVFKNNPYVKVVKYLGINISKEKAVKIEGLVIMNNE